MAKKILRSLKLSKIFYIGLIPIIYFAITTGINKAKRYGIQKYTVEGHSAVPKTIPNFKAGIISGIWGFLILTVLWILLSKLIPIIIKDNTFLNKFFVLGEMTVNNIVTKLFYLGIIVIAYVSYGYGRQINFILSVNNINGIISKQLFSAVMIYVFIFLISLAFWKVICELLLVMFRCFEAYYEIKKNNLK